MLVLMKEMPNAMEGQTGLSRILGVRGSAVARMGDRCFVHPHGYVEGASGRGQEVVVTGGAYVSARDSGP